MEMMLNEKPKFPLEVPILTSSFGETMVCGHGYMGQLGLGIRTGCIKLKQPTNLPFPQQVVAVACGDVHSLVLNANGDVYSFGCNDEGALGRDCSKNFLKFSPALVNLPDKAVKISAGDSHSACLLQDGRVFAWGSFRDSRGFIGLTLEGHNSTPINILPNEVCCDIASGSNHLVMLTVKGRVYTVGSGEHGQLGRVTLRSASGESRRGKTELLQPGQVYIKYNRLVYDIWATSNGTYMRTKDSIYACGLNNYKQLLVGKNAEAIPTPTKIVLDNVKEIVGGQHHTIVLKDDGKCFAIGCSYFGVLGLGDIEIDIMELRQIMALDKHFITNIATSDSQSFAVTDDGDIYAWGMGPRNQLGLPIDKDALFPTLLSSMQTVNKRILQVSTGGQHSIFIVSTNTDAVKKELPITKKRNSLNTSPNDSKKSKKTESTTLKEENGSGSDTETAGKSTIDIKSMKVEKKDDDEVEISSDYSWDIMFKSLANNSKKLKKTRSTTFKQEIGTGSDTKSAGKSTKDTVRSATSSVSSRTTRKRKMKMT